MKPKRSVIGVSMWQRRPRGKHVERPDAVDNARDGGQQLDAGPDRAADPAAPGSARKGHRHADGERDRDREGAREPRSRRYRAARRSDS